MATDMGKLHNNKNIITSIIWKRDASRRVIKGSTIASWSIPNFVYPSSNMIEMKRSVSKWTSLRTRISPIIWREKNIFDTNRIGGSLSISLETLDHWEIVLTSTKRSTLNRLHQDSGERQLRPMRFWKYQQWHQSSSSSSSWWQWSDSWWSSLLFKESR